MISFQFSATPLPAGKIRAVKDLTLSSMYTIIGHTGDCLIEQILRKKVKGEVLDYPLVMSLLRGYVNPRAAITRLLKKKVLIRVKKGLYVFGPDYSNLPYRLEILANLVYGPSCISLQYALASYGLIPERVIEVTCVTPKRDKLFETKVGRFRYRYQRKSRYTPGIDRRVLEDGQATHSV